MHFTEPDQGLTCLSTFRLRIENTALYHTTCCIKADKFTTGAISRINSKHPFLTGWSCKQKMTEIFSEHRNCLGVSTFLDGIEELALQ